MSYRNLDIWKLARDVSKDVHQMSLTMLPKFELYEQGSQIRRSCKSIRANIVEGYGRRDYKQEFIRFLTFALGSCDETTDHLDCLWECESLKDQAIYQDLHDRLQLLGKKLKIPPSRHRRPSLRKMIRHPESAIQPPASRP